MKGLQRKRKLRVIKNLRGLYEDVMTIDNTGKLQSIIRNSELMRMPYLCQDFTSYCDIKTNDGYEFSGSGVFTRDAIRKAFARAYQHLRKVLLTDKWQTVL